MDTKQIELQRHTLIVLCGPTFCGKSTFLKNAFFNKDSEFEPGDVAVVSSDAARYALLGKTEDDLRRYDHDMSSVSQQAFDVISARLNALTTYPVNVPYVVVDTRSMSDGFRKELLDLAKRNHYNTLLVTFEYKTRQEYLQYCETEEEAFIATKDLIRFRREVLPELRIRDWPNRLRIKSRDDNVTFKPQTTLPDTDDRLGLPEVRVDSGTPVAVIGDSHECVEELEALVNKVSSEYGKNTIFIHVGDYLDKGGDTKGMIDLMCKYMSGQADTKHLVLKANHEQYLYRRLIGELEPNPEVDAKYFTALPFLFENPEYADKFCGMFKSSLPYINIRNEEGKGAIVTHAPCEVKYLGKIDSVSARAQRNFYQKNREVPLSTQLDFLYKEANTQHRYHIFGHVSHNSATLLHKNKVFLDTGAAHGGKLSAFVLRGNRFDIVQVDCKQRMADGVDKLPTDLVSGPKVEKQFRLSDYDLDDKDLRLLRQVKANDIQYISGTMPPAPSCEDGLETLKAGLDYFKSKGVDKVVVEPKYMGNRGQLYLHRSAEIEDFAVSRSGWRIRHVDGMDKLLEHWHKTVFQPNPGINSIILDGEILPWTSMGASLIDHTFIPYGDAVRHELSTLAEDKEFASFDLFKDFDAKGRLGDLEKYERTLSIFTQNTPLEFKPFSVLAINGKKYEGDEFDSFTKYNKDTCIDVDLSKEEDYQTARMFYSYLTTEVGMEGVVIKPLVKKPGVVPYMKVRNQEYLRLIYGYDYTRKLDKFIQTKNISGKVSTAIREHDIAEKMIGSDWDTRQELVVKMIGELKKEAALDPRL